MIKQSDSLEFLQGKNDFEFDIMYADPPYQLGSEVIIRPDGMVDYKKAVDFMNKWKAPNGDYWNAWFKEAYRTLKHGGYLIMFGIDRQLLLFKYYANLAGFNEQQSLYWYFISNFPKATDLSKQIDKNAGAEREVIGTKECGMGTGKTFGMLQSDGFNSNKELNTGMVDITAPSTYLAKKYNGYKYSIAPLKQTNETVMVFQKPYKTGSCLHDTLAYENGDDTCGCFALDIDGNRVGTETRTQFSGRSNANSNTYFEYNQDNAKMVDVEGRYPSQTLCDSNTAEVLDKQSGINKSGKNGIRKSNSGNVTAYSPGIGVKLGQNNGEYGDTGGCSKILHKCDFENDEHDIYFYNPKVSKSERNAGCDELEEKTSHLNSGGIGRETRVEKRIENNGTNAPTVRNSHPTLKPIALNYRILKLFKTPNDQRICFPFAGSGSEVIGGIKAGFNNWTGCELNQEYIDIANARIEYWTNKFEEENKKDNQLTIEDLLDK